MPTIFHLAGVVPFMFLLLLVGCGARPLYPLPGRRNDRSKSPLQTFRPYNIAHRGSNGELPEETAAAYMVFFFFFSFITYNITVK